jgi:hypothetical protein
VYGKLRKVLFALTRISFAIPVPLKNHNCSIVTLSKFQIDECEYFDKCHWDTGEVTQQYTFFKNSAICSLNPASRSKIFRCPVGLLDRSNMKKLFTNYCQHMNKNLKKLGK